jgi:hypothetical protein
MTLPLRSKEHLKGLAYVPVPMIVRPQFLSAMLRPGIEREWLKAWREKAPAAGPKGGGQ